MNEMVTTTLHIFIGMIVVLILLELKKHRK